MVGRDEVREKLTGPVTSIMMPFTQDGSVDYDGLRAQVDFCIEGGSTAIILTQGDSRFRILTDQEIADVTRASVEQTSKRALTVAADKSWGQQKEVEFARFASESGADVFMVKPPELHHCSLESYLGYYAAVAEITPVMVVTNVFAGAPIPRSMEILEALRDRIPNIVAVKDDVGGAFVRKMCLLVHSRWAVIAGGQKQNHLNMLHYGCDGYFSTFSNFKPSIAHDYWKAIQDQDYREARRVIEEYDIPFFDFLMQKLASAFFPGMYGTLELFGINQRWNRPPCHTLTDQEMERLKDFLTGKGLL